ncbi:flavin-containing monooxygenase [Nocardia iowensis]|uniref:NAD(P)/FAD-dependent oxidoreductase n=1 Tax=Nocardia iowensis TaxID=204891 RepID=A0ABX8S3X7_NOCIO|nr:NAD(P)/FAD-dependent oxidoreductase [Nocardia iowensis]QXN94606.1 NAD(P)/FAD-dependent oxidoreductase [Nocardia iowensis]
MLTQRSTRHREPANGIPHFKVVVIGAGFGGIGMAVALKHAGTENFTILDSGNTVGGVWRDNTYPDCNCDVPSHLYSFSFAPYRDRRTRYPGQPEILAYLQNVVSEHGLEPHLQLNTAISEATYLDTEGSWWLTTTCGHNIVAEVVVFAVGQLHRPHIPEFPGQSEFSGPAFHSARWDHDQDLHGLDLAVIGTGSSAAQLIPALAGLARTVRVFQRTPNWVLPKPATHFGPLARIALAVPFGHKLYRHALAYGADAVLAPIMRRGWSARPAEWAARRYLRREISDPVLRAKLTPDYPVGGKRILVDSGYYQALNEPNVELITDPITNITTTGIQTADNRHHHADAIIYATGFHASEFLVPVTVRGRGGRLLHEQWSTGAQAFMGLAVPGYPNAFLIAGSNSFNPAGSNPEMKERQINYILKCLRWREETGAATVEVSADAMGHHQEWMRTTLAKTVWPYSVSSWYKHPSGRVTNPWPSSARTFRRMLRHHPSQVFTAMTGLGTGRTSTTQLASGKGLVGGTTVRFEQTGTVRRRRTR